MADYFKEAKKARNQRDFLKAGDLYVMGGDIRSAIESYLAGGHFGHAARLYEKDQDYRNAARYYGQAQSYEKSAQLYVNAGDFRRASEMFEKCNDLSRASEMAQKAGDLNLAASLADRAGKHERAADLYVKVQNYERAAEIYTQLMEHFLLENRSQGFLESNIVRAQKYANAAGSLHAKLHHYEIAARCFEAADIPAKAAECHSRNGRHERAAELFASAEDFGNAAKNYEKAGRTQKASEMFERSGDSLHAAELAEKSGHLERAAALYAKGEQIQKAADILFQVVLKGVEERGANRLIESQRMMLRKTATSAAALYNRLNQPARAAWCFEQADNFAKAAECYLQVGNHQKAGELFLRAGQPAKAYETLTAGTEGVEKPEVLAEACNQLMKFSEAGDLFMIVQDTARAAESYQKAGNHYKAAMLFEQDGKPARAAALYSELEEYKKAAELFGKAGQHLEAAQMHEKAGDHALAIEAYRHADEPVSAARLVAETVPQQAISLLQEVPLDHVQYRAACAMLGHLFESCDMNEQAVQKLSEAVANETLDGGNVEQYYNLARVQEKLRQRDNALANYEQVVSYDPAYADAMHRMQQLRAMPDFTESSHRESSQPSAPMIQDMAGTDSRIGTRIREYEILDVLGRGGMGAVYRARHVFLDKERAIKLIEAKMNSPEFENRFIREARILSGLQSPYLVQLLEFGVLEDHQFFMVLELIHGESAKARLKRLGRIPLADALRIVSEAAMGLAAAHDKGIVHRDISPDNLMLVPADAGKETTKVIDFGIAKPLSEETDGVTLANMFLGKPEFASPEQCGFLNAHETIDHRTDIYSLAVTLYCMLTGTLPFYSPTPQGYLVKHLAQDPKPLSEHFEPGEMPDSINEFIMKALSKTREKRHASMAEFLQELGSL